MYESDTNTHEQIRFGSSLGKCETDLTVGHIEMSVVLVDEGVTENEGFLKRRGEGHTLDSENALSLTLGGNLEDVVSGVESVGISGDDEGESGVSAELRAVDVLGTFVGEGLEHFGNGCFGSNEDGSTSVNNGVLNLIGRVSEDNSADFNNPPGFENNGVVFEGGSSKLRVNTTKNEG